MKLFISNILLLFTWPTQSATYPIANSHRIYSKIQRYRRDLQEQDQLADTFRSFSSPIFAENDNIIKCVNNYCNRRFAEYKISFIKLLHDSQKCLSTQMLFSSFTAAFMIVLQINNQYNSVSVKVKMSYMLHYRPLHYADDCVITTYNLEYLEGIFFASQLGIRKD